MRIIEKANRTIISSELPVVFQAVKCGADISDTYLKDRPYLQQLTGIIPGFPGQFCPAMTEIY